MGAEQMRKTIPRVDSRTIWPPRMSISHKDNEMFRKFHVFATPRSFRNGDAWKTHIFTQILQKQNIYKKQNKVLFNLTRELSHSNF